MILYGYEKDGSNGRSSKYCTKPVERLMTISLIIIFQNIACAVSAPKEGTALTELKNQTSRFFYQTEGNKTRGLLYPQVYNVQDNKSSILPTSTTSSYFRCYIRKQYQNNKNSYCSSEKNLSSGKKKNIFSSLDFGFKQRKLLWTDELKSESSLKRQMPKEKSNKVRKIIHKYRLKKTLGQEELNKVMQNLVKKLNASNSESDSNSDSLRETRNEKKVRSFKNSFEQIFKKNNRKKKNKNARVSSVAVNVVRGKYWVDDVKNHISNYNNLRNFKKARFRRIPHNKFSNFKFANKINPNSDLYKIVRFREKRKPYGKFKDRKPTRKYFKNSISDNGSFYKSQIEKKSIVNESIKGFNKNQDTQQNSYSLKQNLEVNAEDKIQKKTRRGTNSKDTSSKKKQNDECLGFPIYAQTSKINKRLTLDRYLQIRNSLRNYLIQNELWSPAKRAANIKRRKVVRRNCGGKSNSNGSCTSRKSIKSAPLLCVPFIRKGQDDVIKYLINRLQKLIGKPFPQKDDIFEKTKYKPPQKKPCEDNDENSSLSTTEEETEVTPGPDQNQIDLWTADPCGTTGTCATIFCPPATSCFTSQTSPPTTCSTTCATTTCSSTITASPTASQSNITVTINGITSTSSNHNLSTTPKVLSGTVSCYTTPNFATANGSTIHNNHNISSTNKLGPSTENFSTVLEPNQNQTTNVILKTTEIPPVSQMFTTFSPTTGAEFGISNFTFGATTDSVTNPSFCSQFTTASCHYTTTPFCSHQTLPSTGCHQHKEEKTSISNIYCNHNCGGSSSSCQTLFNQFGTTTPSSFSNGYMFRTTLLSVPLPMQMTTYAPITSPNANKCIGCKGEHANFHNEYFSISTNYFTPITPGDTLPFQPPPAYEGSKNLNYNNLGQNKMLYPTYDNNLDNVLHWPTTMSSLQMNEPIEFEIQAENLDFDKKDYATKRHYLEKYPEFNKGKVNRDNARNAYYAEKYRKRKFNDGFTYKPRNFRQDDDLKDNGEKEKMSFSKKHFDTKPYDKPSKRNYKPYKDPLIDNYDFYEKSSKDTKSNLKNYRHPIPWIFHKNLSKKKKKYVEFPKVKRQKRSQNSWLENQNSNDYYSDDYNYNNEYKEKRRGTEKECLDCAESTPPSYALFSDLAMAAKNILIKNPAETTTDYAFYDEEKRVDNEKNYEENKVIKSETTTLGVSVFDAQTTMSCFETTLNSPSTTPSSNEPKFDYSETGASNVQEKNNNMKPNTTLPSFFLFPEITTQKSQKAYLADALATPCLESFSDSNSQFEKKETHLLDLERLEKEPENDLDLDNSNEGQVVTTLKYASIARGPKKLQTKPSPKIYSKVYPDSLPNESEVNETEYKEAAGGSTTSSKNAVEKPTVMQAPIPDTRLQLLAVCEGYLEVVKFVKAQNISLEEELDSDLSRYCENIISQSFNSPTENNQKINKSESSQPLLATNFYGNVTSTPNPSTNHAVQNVTSTPIRNSAESNSRVKYLSDYKFLTDLKDRELQDKIVINLLRSPVFKRELVEKVKETKFKNKKMIRKSKLDGIKKHLQYLGEKRVEGKEDFEFEAKGVPEEQVELLHLLGKRKRALLTWLFSPKEEQIKSDDRETEYFDDEEGATPVSGTLSPKEVNNNENFKVKSKSNTEPLYPVYARQYGYDKGGELREVEVFWRKIDEKTHEKHVFKNMSILALLLTSTNPPIAKKNHKGLLNSNSDGSSYENDESSEKQLKTEGRMGIIDLSASVINISQVKDCSTGKIHHCDRKNDTQYYVNKPDPSSIIGCFPNVTTAHPNVTQKMSQKLATAKGYVQEYAIEFLNYAVYILPIMFTILFLFCCVCCALQILKKRKKKKKKKKEPLSTDDETETTDESERKVKKKRRGLKKYKKELKIDPDEEQLNKKRSKTFWNALKLHSGKPSSEFNDENSTTEKKRSFLRFLKSRKEEAKSDDTALYDPVPELDEEPKEYKKKQNPDLELGGYTPREIREEEKKKNEEANERRELIALLEELKKIETENTKENLEKKDQKSVYVQYMTQEEENSVFKNQDLPRYSQKVLLPQGAFCRKQFPFHDPNSPALENYELYEDVGERSELIPCDCVYYCRKNDFLKGSNLRINRGTRCERFFNIFRDSSVPGHLRKKEFPNSERGDGSFVINKYESAGMEGDRLVGGSKKQTGTKVDMTEMSSFGVKDTDIVEEMDNFKRQLNKKKYVRLKDDGVLCRL